MQFNTGALKSIITKETHLNLQEINVPLSLEELCETWEWPCESWTRVHLDFVGSIMDHMCLILVNVCTKWPEVYIMNSITSAKTIEELQFIFSTYSSHWQ